VIEEPAVKERSFVGLTTEGFHRVAYTEWGERNDEPVVVCVHGLSRNGRDFDYLAKALQSKRRVACVDVVGRGRSDWLTDKKHYTLPTYCADMTAFLARLDSDVFDFVGTSMGGMIGMILAAQPNSPIRRLVINDTGPFIPKEAPQRILAYVENVPTFPTIGDAERYLREHYAPFGPLTDEQWAHLTRHSLRKTADGHYVFLYDPGIVLPMRSTQFQDLKMWPIWDQIICPVLVLRGAESDVLLPETVEQMKRRGPPVQVVEFPGVGHAPTLMDRDQIEVIRRFLLA
jgi:pimeloyl-ACP methyl ester carboxylesterase